LSRLETDGLDVQINWGRDLAGGNFNLTAFVTFLNSMKTAVDPTASFREWQGTLGPNDLSGVNGGSYDYRTFTTGSYARGPWTASLRWRHLPSVESAGSVTGNNTVLATESYDAFDASGSFEFNERTTLRVGIDNLLNTDPPITDRTRYSPGANTNAGFYDVLGRRAYVALGMSF
jgi:outer membrane receptor protein involved in Fe transport